MTVQSAIIAGVWFLLALVFCAFYNASEYAYTHVNGAQLEKAAESGGRRGNTAFRLWSDLSRTLYTIVFGNTMATAAVAAIAVIIARAFFDRYAVPIATAVSVALVLVFGETIPKTYGQERADAFTVRSAPLIRLSAALFKPVISLCVKIVGALSPIWTPESPLPSYTEEELVEMVGDIEEGGEFDENTGELIRSAIEFSDMTAHEMLIPRVDIVALNIEEPLSSILENEEMLRYSRVPVYEENLDNIIGILNTKHLFKSVLKNHEIDIRSLLLEPFFVHMTMTADDLLREFRLRRQHMAIVVDE